jgi:hypothetical protein
MSYYYSNPGGFSISKTVLPSVTSSICQSAGLNSGGVVRESASVSTTSTAVGPYIQQLGGGGGGGGGSAGGSVISITITNGGSGYTRGPPTLQITGGGGSGATATCTVSSGSINSVTVTNGGSGYTSVPTVIISTPPSVTAILTPVISSGSSASTSTSFQQVVDNDPKIFLLK